MKTLFRCPLFCSCFTMSRKAQDAPTSPLTPASPPSSPALGVACAAVMNLVLRENDAIRISTFENGALVDVKTVVEGSDVSECDVVFAPTGQFFAFADAESVSVVDSACGNVVHKIADAKIVSLMFSPKGSFLVTYAHPDAKKTDGNMGVYNVATGELLLRCVQATWPALEWTSDEQFCLRPVAGVLCVHDGRLEGKDALEKLELQLPREKVFETKMSPSELPFVALFKPHHKQAQASLRVFRLPSLKDDMLNLNFGRAEGASIQWSKSASALSVVLRMETDKTGQSYYGTSSLTIVQVRDRTMQNIALSSGESIHDIQWSPVADEFIVVHGAMPKNKATLYNSKAQPLCSFGEAPRNLIHWAPNGKMFVLGGSGNLAGEFQFYDRDAAVAKSSTTGDGRLGFFSEKSSVQVWTPDSRHLLCATIFSRLRIDNKIVVWKHNGERVLERKFKVLQNATFIPQSPLSSAFPVRRPSPTVAAVAKPTSAAYRPPVRSAGAAALLARAPAAAAGQVKAAGPVGGQVADPKKKVKR